MLIEYIPLKLLTVLGYRIKKIIKLRIKTMHYGLLVVSLLYIGSAQHSHRLRIGLIGQLPKISVLHSLLKI